MRYVITHGHIFKNAGTTFDHSLKQAFGKDFCDHRDDKDMRRGGAEYLKQFILDNPNLKAISSHHLCNPLPNSEQFTCLPVYFLRNPIERIISVYNFERKQKPTITPGAKMASKVNLVDYVKWRMEPNVSKVIFNYQTAYLGREGKPDKSRDIDSAMFSNALNRVTSSNVYVGTVEKFDESFTYITNSLQQYFPEVNFTYKRKNTTNDGSYDVKFQTALEKLTPILTDVISRNTYDLALHNIASERLGPIVSNQE